MDHEECKFQKKDVGKEYASGFGSHLKLSDARGHNDMLVEFMTSVDKNKAILDVGCGEGLFWISSKNAAMNIIWVSIFQMSHWKMP
jgi:2-polyprenyl-3-methyl-5-hydroxy-6-metoxy-1,4-benzoquinol methylase